MMSITGKKGFGLGIFVVILTLILVLILCQNYYFMTTDNIMIASRISDTVRAYYIADTGLAVGLETVRNGAANTFNIGSQNHPINYPIDLTRSGTYYVVCTRSPSSPIGTVPQWTISSTARYNNATKTLEFGCREAALSQWVYNTGSEWCPQWNGPGYWITGDTFRGGPVNTNGRFYVSGSPTFYGPATQHDPNVGYLNPGTDSPNWLGGLTTGTPIITIDTTVATGIINIASAIIPPATSAGDKDIELVSDGTILITPYDTNGNKLPPAVLFVPNATKPMIYVPGSTAKVTVHGTLKGQLTIVSDSDIIVTSDILYHDFGPSVPPTIPGTGGTTIPNPNYNAASTDLLGLVSNKNVMIAAAGNPTVDGQVVARCIEIDASIMTPNGCVWVEDYGSTPHGVLTTFGGMTSATGGGTGTFSGNTMIYGYHVDMRYDPRLALLVPPGFASATDSTSRVIYTKTSFNEPFGS